MILENNIITVAEIRSGVKVYSLLRYCITALNHLKVSFCAELLSSVKLIKLSLNISVVN